MEASRTAAHQHQFDSAAQQYEASALGMWVFLVTEIMFFGGILTAYVVYRSLYPESFAHVSNHLSLPLGAFNTVVLIGSSLTMALAVHAGQLGRRLQIVVFLALTMLLGSVFLGIKAYEYHHKFVEGLVPGPLFTYEGADRGPAQMFMCLYFGLTGIHALHMVIGVGVLAVILAMAWRGRFSAAYSTPVEMSGLYWHFVDVVWIFLFPLLYLLGRTT